MPSKKRSVGDFWLWSDPESLMRLGPGTGKSGSWAPLSLGVLKWAVVAAVKLFVSLSCLYKVGEGGEVILRLGARREYVLSTDLRPRPILESAARAVACVDILLDGDIFSGIWSVGDWVGMFLNCIPVWLKDSEGIRGSQNRNLVFRGARCRMSLIRIQKVRIRGPQVRSKLFAVQVDEEI